MSQTAKPKRVVFALYEGIQLIDVAGAASVFAGANQAMKRKVYDLEFVCSAPDGIVDSHVGLGLAGKRLPRKVDDIHTLVVPGAEYPGLRNADNDAALMRWLARAASKAERVMSVCSGAIILGRLGLLDGKRVTSHWRALDILQKQNPNASVADDCLYVNDGSLWTSAGALSGVDMTLAIVAQDLSTSVALNIARNLVVHLIREGGQSQFSGPIDLQTKAQHTALPSLVAWLEDRLKDSVTVEAMADYMNTSVRTLHRRCLEVFEMTPAQVLTELRLERSRDLLHQPELGVKIIARECGFSDASSFSKAFSRRYGVTPTRYRHTFRETA